MTDERIDWPEYNAPPYFPQWLARGETLELARFDDRLRMEVETQTRLIAGQHDIDGGSGFLLDRVGKILAEPRTGMSDDVYRRMLQLRTLINTTNGSVNDIIKVIKFLYESEVIRIVPDYPAGLIIERDGEGPPGLDFNRILAETVAAGVSFATKELFDFFEDLLSAETQLVRARRDVTEIFGGRVFHDGGALHDGQATHMFGYGEETGFLFRGLAMEDAALSRALHNGGMSHDGGFRHDGVLPYPMHDTFSIQSLDHEASDNFGSDESALVNQAIFDEDRFRKPNYFDGAHRHDGTILGSGWIIDALSLSQKLPLRDAAAGTTRHDGTLRHDGSETHRGLGSVFAYERQSAGFRFDVADESDMAEAAHALELDTRTAEPFPVLDGFDSLARLSPFGDLALGTLLHNGSIRHDGRETHSRAGKEPLYETAATGFRLHRYHDGAHVFNGGVRHNSNVLYPLEDIA